MAYRRVPFALGEWYHCYNRGVDKRTVFENKHDYERFLETLYIANDTDNVNHNNIQHLSHAEIMRLSRGKPLVSIGAFCLMPNHFHLLINEIEDGGISKFMHKVGTSYTMYFNVKNDRVGNLFVKPFRSKHVVGEGYFRRVVQYIHLNPAEIFEPGWKSGTIRSMNALERKVREYPYSSYPSYVHAGANRYDAIVDAGDVRMLREAMPSMASLISQAAQYHANLE